MTHARRLLAPGSAARTKRLTLAVGVVGLVLAWAAPALGAPAQVSDTCVAISKTNLAWPVLLDTPDLQLLSDGNDDGLPTLLDRDFERLPEFADDLDDLAAQLPDDLAADLGAFATAVRKVAGEPAPADADDARPLVEILQGPGEVVQSALETLGCRADRARENAAAESAQTPADVDVDNSGSGLGGAGALLLLLFLGAILGIGPAVYAVVFWLTPRGPLSVSPDGQHLAGRLSGWTVSTFTGRVAAASTFTRVSHRVFQRPGGYVESDVSSTLHQTVLLEDGAGRQHSHEIPGSTIFPGQVITICFAHRAAAHESFAVLNHSAGTSFAIREAITRIQMTSRLGRGVSLALLVIGGLFLAVTTACCALFVLLPIAHLLNRKQATTGDLSPLWRLTSDDATSLRRTPL